MWARLYATPRSFKLGYEEFQRGSPLSFLAHGISYGLASLRCSLPVFLAVMTQGRYAFHGFPLA